MQRFMIVMPWGRVGSNLVLAAVQRRARLTHGPDGFFITNEPLNQIKDRDAQIEWLNQHYAPRDGVSLIGSKQAVRAMADPKAVAEGCRELAVQVVVMHRRNLVKAAVSQIRAEQYAEKTKQQTGQPLWGVKPGSSGLGPSEIDPDVLLTRIGIMARTTEALLNVFGPLAHLSVVYEDIQIDPHAVIDRVCSALSLRLAPIQLAFEKATSSVLREDVTNFEQLRDRLAGTAYHEQLLEV